MAVTTSKLNGLFVWQKTFIPSCRHFILRYDSKAHAFTSTLFELYRYTKTDKGTDTGFENLFQLSFPFFMRLAFLTRPG